MHSTKKTKDTEALSR